MGAFLLTAGTAVAATEQPGAISSPGEAELHLLELFLTSSYGLTIGLGVAIYGLFRFSQNETGTGIALLLVGACITFAPGILNGFRLIVCPVTAALGHEISC